MSIPRSVTVPFPASGGGDRHAAQGRGADLGRAGFHARRQGHAGTGHPRRRHQLLHRLLRRGTHARDPQPRARQAETQQRPVDGGTARHQAAHYRGHRGVQGRRHQSQARLRRQPQPLPRLQGLHGAQGARVDGKKRLRLHHHRRGAGPAPDEPAARHHAGGGARVRRLRPAAAAAVRQAPARDPARARGLGGPQQAARFQRPQPQAADARWRRNTASRITPSRPGAAAFSPTSSTRTSSPTCGPRAAASNTNSTTSCCSRSAATCARARISS